MDILATRTNNHPDLQRVYVIRRTSTTHSLREKHERVRRVWNLDTAEFGPDRLTEWLDVSQGQTEEIEIRV